MSLQLSHAAVTCRRCCHQWIAYLHGFSRGHAVLIKDGRIAFLGDDVACAFLDRIDAILKPQDPGTSVGDPADALRDDGWRGSERCPNCNALLDDAKYDRAMVVDVLADEFSANDFRLVGRQWQLTESGRNKSSSK